MTDTIPMPTDDALDRAQSEVLRKAPLNVFRMSAYVPGILVPFYDMTIAMLRHGRLDPRSREILILRTAAVNRATYEWRHHATMAARQGLLTDTEIARLSEAGDVPGLSPDDALLVRAAEEIARDVSLSGETRAEIRRRYPIEIVVEIVFCCSYYNMVSRFLVSTGTPFEEGGITMDVAMGSIE